MLKFKFITNLVIFCLFCIFISSFSLRYNILFNFYVLDDFILILNNSFINSIKNIIEVLNPINLFNVLPIRCGARPITVATLIIDFYINNLNPFGYHFVNLLLHSLNSCLIFLFCYFLKKDNLFFPILASLFFSFHPIQTEVVSVISFRADLLLTFFSLIVLNILNVLKFDNIKINKNIIFLFVFVFVCFSFFSKENAIVLPIIIFLYILFFCKSVNLLKESIIIFGIILFLFFYFWIERFPVPLFFTIYPNLPEYIKPLSNFTNYSYTIIISLFYNVSHILYPINLSVDYSLVFSKQIFIFTLVFIVLFFYVLIFIKNKYIKFSMLSTIFMYLPISNIVPLVNTVADRYMYYPMIPISILFGLLILELQKIFNKKILIILLCLLFSTNVFISYTRSKVYFNQYSLYSDAMTKTNKNIRVLYNMAIAYFDNKEYEKCINTMNELININPIYMRDIVWFIMAMAHEQLNDKEEAIKYFHKAFLLNPRNEDCINKYVSSFSTIKDSINYFITHTQKINIENLSLLQKYKNIDDKK